MEPSQQLFEIAIKTFSLDHLNEEQLRKLKASCVQIIEQRPFPAKMYEWLMLLKEKLPDIEKHTVAEYF